MTNLLIARRVALQLIAFVVLIVASLHGSSSAAYSVVDDFGGKPFKSIYQSQIKNTCINQETDDIIQDKIHNIGKIVYKKSYIVSYILDINDKIAVYDANIIAEEIIRSSKKYNISPTVILGLIKIESDFRKNVKSSKGAIGLMQVMPSVWLSKSNDKNLIKAGIAHSKKDLYNIKTNIRAGVYVLAQYRDEALANNISSSKVMNYALTRYNGGFANNHAKKTYHAVQAFLVSANNMA